MKSSNSSPWVLGPVCISVAVLLLSPTMSQRARAFGGFWSANSATVQQSGVQVLFVDEPGPTVTAIIQIAYAGPAEKFAWLIPVPGTPAVSVSSSTVFERLDAVTAPQYWVSQAVEGACASQDVPDPGYDPGTGLAGAPIGPDAKNASIAVVDHDSVGPYDYVNIEVDPGLSDPAAVAIDWLTANGYDLTDVDRELLGPYLQDGLNLLAFKLGKDRDAGAIRPVILTYESELPLLPIRPAAIAAHDDMGVQVWVIGPSQAVPVNYRSLVINDALIDWLTGRRYVAGTLPSGGAGPFGGYVSKPSNYDAVVTAAANEAGGQGFVTELGGPTSQYRDAVWSSLDDQTFAMIAGESYPDGIDAILAASIRYGGWDGWKEAVESATALPADLTLEEFGRSPDAYRGIAQVDTAKLFELLENDVIAPVARTAALFYQAPYLTRLYSTMSSGEMTVDPKFDYNADLAQISNIHLATQSIACSPDLDQRDAPWRMLLPQGGVITGDGSQDWPVAAGSLPANLKVVMLSTSGSGMIVEDNSDAIAKALFGKGAAGSAMAALRPPQTGVLIGGSQTVTPYQHASSTPSRMKPAAGDACSVSVVGARTHTGLALALWLPLVGLFRALRKRAWLLLVLLAGCGSGDDAPARGDGGTAVPAGALTREQLRDPETCKGCHPTHYREWSSSMHAYAAKDPVFIAMNKRGQRETHGKLGDFCVKCHAPMAVIDGRSDDGLDLQQLPDSERGVSCYFCHNVTGIDGDHNGMLHLANDTTMRGPIEDPLEQSAHRAEFSELFEDTSPKSSALCGGCHDIVTPNGVHLERTFQEYRAGIFSKSATGEPPAFDSCVGCHMRPQSGFAAVMPEGVEQRLVHEHLWPGVDVALTEFPNREAQRSAVEDCQIDVSVAFFTLEVTPPDLFTFQMETGAGHNQPSGAAQDRRMWLEFLAYDANGELLADASSGNIADDEIEERAKSDPGHDPHLLMFRDRIYDAEGEPVHMFWEAATSQAHPEGYESNVLPVATTTYVEGRHAVLKQYRATGKDGGLPAKVTARLRMRPIGLDVLQDLVDSGDLDPEVVAQMPTFSFGSQIEWTPEAGVMKTVAAEPKSDCSTYRCMLDPGSQHCH